MKSHTWKPGTESSESSMQLSDLLKALKPGTVYHPINEAPPVKNIWISGICSDSRLAGSGSLFVAVRGESHDGHEYISEAMNKGAVAVIAENAPAGTGLAMELTSTAVGKGHRGASGAAWIQVPDSRLALAQVAAQFYRHPSRHLSLVGITGTSGKTTTSCLLHHIYESAGLTAGLIGTVKVHCSRQSWPAKMTTPDALELQRLLRLMVDSGVSHGAMEVSSHGLSQKRVDEISFRGAVFTNIAPNHLDFHQTLKAYVDAKGRLASLVEDGGFILVNGDDSHFKNLPGQAEVLRISLGTNRDCDVLIKHLFVGKEGGSFQLSPQRPSAFQEGLTRNLSGYTFKTPLLGKHNVLNAAAAAVSALLTGVSEDEVIRGLATFPGVERRLNSYQLKDLHVIDDTAMSPGSIHAVFHTLKELSLARSPVIVAYALRGRRGTQVNEDNGRALAGWIKSLEIEHFITTNSTECVDDGNTVLPEEEKAFFQGARTTGATPTHFSTLEEALERAVQVATPGAVLLLLGAQGMDDGWKMLQNLLPEKGSTGTVLLLP